MKAKRDRYALSYALAFFAFSVICAMVALALALPMLGRRSVGNTHSAAVASGRTVVIDAGHGGEDGGTVGFGLVEKDLNLDLALRLAALLRESGVDVVLTRETDTMLYDKNADFEGKKKALDLRARLEIAERCTAPVFVSIHMNYFVRSEYSGLQVYYSPNDPQSRLLAEMVQSRVRQELQPNNHRAVKASEGSIFLLDRLTCPAVLVECGFLSNRDEAHLLSTEEYRSALAAEIFHAITDFLADST